MINNTTMNFGQAIEALKEGKLVTRNGWNGKGMWLYQTIGNIVPKDFIPKFTSLPSSVKEKLTELDIDVVFLPSITMFTANKTMQPGWLASQSDILAEDWEII